MNRADVFVIFLLGIILARPASVDAQDLPQPPVITALSGQPPSDAIVLFDGMTMSRWTHVDGSPAAWKIDDGAMIVGNQSIISKQEFGSIQLHLEWATPSTVEGDGQGRGNSGVFLMGQYEIQVLDSYENETYADGMAGAVYKQHVPLVNSARRPGAWQTYDIIFHAPRFDAQGNQLAKGVVTVLYNGVLIQDNVEIQGPTRASVKDTETGKGPVSLQNHRNPVRYRNIWVREL